MKTCVYVDAYNLYYGSLKGTAYKWLNLGALAAKLLPRDDVVRIRYCTAKVKNHRGKDGTSQRQDIYLRALRTIPNLSIHLGRYQYTKKWMRAVDPKPSASTKVLVHHSEEKGSDVNLATYMLLDSMRGECEQVVLISNDSDLSLPVQLLKTELGKRVVVFAPTTNPGRTRSYELSRAASRIRDLRAGPLQSSQFPDTLSDAIGVITKPKEW